ncbi:hypothetical protein J2Z66_002425 [Paenibacillus eucommiae]|uniref:Uncharacterized protein n=1 Tax=Paenibacillus eucommiae TaxID=1355755 RepID=A0ABS4ITD0_9BACL|nr:hypothetical protein [Paenibacillus eucommiae]
MNNVAIGGIFSHVWYRDEKETVGFFHKNLRMISITLPIASIQTSANLRDEF